jgi:ribosomal protein S18 acetylase RimI-like enzyme
LQPLAVITFRRHLPTDVRAATLADRPALIAALASAFIDDPAMAWIYPDRARRPAQLLRFFDLITGADARLDLAYVAVASNGDIVGAALWRPPGHAQMPTSALIAALPRMVTTFGFALPRSLGLMGAMDREHDQRPHWYLQFIGVIPQAQGLGLGGALLKAGIDRADLDGTSACYLETATPANVGLYQSRGFAVRNQWQHGDGPAFWSMWKAASD